MQLFEGMFLELRTYEGNVSKLLVLDWLVYSIYDPQTYEYGKHNVEIFTEKNIY